MNQLIVDGAGSGHCVTIRADHRDVTRPLFSPGSARDVGVVARVKSTCGIYGVTQVAGVFW